MTDRGPDYPDYSSEANTDISPLAKDLLKKLSKAVEWQEISNLLSATFHLSADHKKKLQDSLENLKNLQTGETEYATYLTEKPDGSITAIYTREDTGSGERSTARLIAVVSLEDQPSFQVSVRFSLQSGLFEIVDVTIDPVKN